MRWIIIFAIFIVTLVTAPAAASDGQTAREEAEGKAVWEKLQAKQLGCKNLTDDNYEVLGEYFMGQTVGGSHEVMNNMIEKMMGKEGEEQMHIVMGNRRSGCKGGDNSVMGYSGWNNMMGGWGGFGIFGWLTMVLFWALLILGVIALVRYLSKASSNKGEKTPWDILKERYAKGEVDKKEFEEMQKDLKP